LKQTLSSDREEKVVVTRERHGSSTSAVTSTTTTKKKFKEDQKEKSVSNTSLSSPSTDVDIISSSSIDSSKAKQTQQQTTHQDKKIDDASQTSSTGPYQTAEENLEQQQQPNDKETTLQPQISSSSSTAIEPSVQSKPLLPLAKTVATTTLRVKASTSPDEEEEDDTEGFQVVRYRKRISSAPQSEKSLPPLPPKSSYKQKFSRDINLKPVVIHGRHGSESRSMPRANTSGQTSSHQRQQNRPKQDRSQLPPFSTSRPAASQETHRLLSLSDMESKSSEQTKATVSDKRQRMSDSTLQSSYTDQVLKPIEQKKESTDIEHQTIRPVLQSKLSDQTQQQKSIETKPKQLSTTVSLPADKSTQQIVQEYHIPTTDEIKTAAQQTSSKEIDSSTVASAPTSITAKSSLTGGDDDDDDDGFQVVRYRKHTPSSTASIPISKQQSSGSDSDRKRTNIPRKQSSSPSITIPTKPILPTTIPKKKPTKPKKTKEETVVSHTSPSVDIVSSSAIGNDFVSSSIEEFRSQITTIENIPSNLESSITTEDDSSPRLEKIVTTTTTTSETITKEVNEPVLATDLSEPVQKPLNKTENELQPTVSTTSPSVTSADTSEESAKKSKKKT
jgi:hypothetical protein